VNLNNYTTIMKKYCLICRKETPFEFVGVQKSHYRQTYFLYNCKICHTTKAFDIKSLESRINEKNKK